MKCTKVHLQERTKTKVKAERRTNDKPRRYCQKILVDPDFEENSRWSNILLQRFNSTEYNDCDAKTPVISASRTPADDVYLTVQTLQFKGEPLHCERPRTSFKYKALQDGQKHRMFVKQAIDENISSDDDQDSEITCCYLKDYANYFINNEQSRPSSAKSSIYLRNLDNKLTQNKSVQVDFKPVQETKSIKKKLINTEIKENISSTKSNIPEINESCIDDSKISFHRNGKRKSITILKTDNSETVQVIRVDVVCNYRRNSLNSNDEFKTQTCSEELNESKRDEGSLKGTNYGNKYLLTKSIKALDEKVSCGANVTLLCKTFRLADRSKTSRKQDVNQRY